jgi:predicted small lipoprotein YifL
MRDKGSRFIPALVATALVLLSLLGCGIVAGSEAPPAERPSANPPVQVQITFSADSTRLRPGECAGLAWDVAGGF